MKPHDSPLIRRVISYILIVLILVQTYSCHYFRVRYPSTSDPGSIKDIGKIHKSFLVHSGDQIYTMKSIEVDSLNLYGMIDFPIHKVYYTENRSFRYKPYERNILNEVHIYLNDDVDHVDIGKITIPHSAVKEIRIIEKNTGKTTATYVFSAFGIIIGVFIIITIIYALIKSSCPYVYVHDGDSFIFQGEIFGGAIGKNLERDDFLLLPDIKPLDGTYKVRISNELKERQYTDLTQLVVVNHPEGQQVLLDQTGKPRNISVQKPALNALSASGEDLGIVLSTKDQEVYFFNDAGHTVNSVELQFDRPHNEDVGKLVLNTKNTLWFDYIFGEFLKEFGGNFNSWMEKQSKISRSERIQLMNENDFPLSIYLNKNGEWELVERLYTIGPLASRDFVVPLDLSDIKGEEINIKLETGFMFWEIDYAAIDYSDDPGFVVEYIKPSLAVGTGSVDWTAALNSADNVYMAQEVAGEVTELTFKVPPLKDDNSQSVFLHCRGYYELVRDFTGLPNITQLNKFRTPGYFSEFSREKYLQKLGFQDGITSTKSYE
jgi:hypothetical protein